MKRENQLMSENSHVTPREGTIDKTFKPTHERKLPRNTSQGDKQKDSIHDTQMCHELDLFVFYLNIF